MIVDLFLVYQFIRRLATPFNKWKAYELGIIDDQGKVLRKKKDLKTKPEKDAWGLFDIMVANMKKLLAKVPGGSTRLASYAAALFLIKEHKAFTEDSLLTEDMDEDDLEERLSIFSEAYLNYTTLDDRVNGFLLEKLKKSDDMGKWIDDFYDSDAPQFKGKSKSKRRQMAVAAKLDAMDEACWDTHKQVGMKKKGNKMVPNCVPKNEELEEAAADKPPIWKKAGPDGEIEIKFPTGRRFKVEKQYDSNIRHKGEWKVMEWDARSKDWEWTETYSPKAYAKEMALKLGQYKNGKQVADYSSTFKFEAVEKNKNINTKPELDEEPANNVGSGNIAGMDAGHMSKEAQKKWTSSNKSSKKKKLRDIMGVLKK